MQEYSEKWGRQNVLLHSLLGVSNLKQGGSPAVDFNFSIKDKKLVSKFIVRPTIEYRYDCDILFVQLWTGYLYTHFSELFTQKWQS